MSYFIKYLQKSNIWGHFWTFCKKKNEKSFTNKWQNGDIEFARVAWVLGC